MRPRRPDPTGPNVKNLIGDQIRRSLYADVTCLRHLKSPLVHMTERAARVLHAVTLPRVPYFAYYLPSSSRSSLLNACTS